MNPLTIILAIGMFGVVITGFTINGTDVNMTGINSGFSVQDTWEFSSMTLESDHMYVTNMNRSNTSQSSNSTNEYLTFNFTESGATYDGSALPFFLISNSVFKNMSTNLQMPMNVTATINTLNCSININYTSGQQNYNNLFEEPTCNSQRATITFTVEDTFNIFDIIGISVDDRAMEFYNSTDNLVASISEKGRILGLILRLISRPLDTCNENTAGEIKYNAPHFYGCNSTHWKQLDVE